MKNFLTPGDTVHDLHRCGREVEKCIHNGILGLKPKAVCKHSARNFPFLVLPFLFTRENGGSLELL